MATSLSFTAFARNALNFPRSRTVQSMPAAGLRNKPERHGRELFLNHVWESLNAGAKILLFAVVTPMMLATWGQERFGLFAVANSCVALMAIVDLGLRTLTRVGLTNPHLSNSGKVRLHALNVAAFSAAGGSGVTIVTVLSLAGCWHRWLHLPPSGDLVIAMTAALTVAMMLTQLLLERIAAAGHLSRIKAALFVGNLLAFAMVVALLKHGGTVTGVTTAYFAALGFPLLFLLPVAHLNWRDFTRAVGKLQRHEISGAIKSGGWINLITASWIFQSYGLVLLISWVLGPAVAGTFFLFLKLSELLSVLGASASEPTIAALARAPTPLDRHRNFASGYKSAIALCLTGVVGYSFFCGDLFRIWLHRSLDHPYTGMLIGLFGVMSGFSRMVTAASLGVAKPRAAALGSLAGATFVAGAIMAFRSNAAPETILAAASVSSLLLLPGAVIISRDFGSTFNSIWIEPLIRFTPSLTVITFICWMAARSESLVWIATAILGSALICARYALRPAANFALTSGKDSRLGYDTRSLRSALVMKGIDLLNPFRRAEQFAWSGPCVVSSTGGLGDLFVHLPLIAGILNEAERRHIEIRVALRPVHAALGRACGWRIVPFDNALEDFFKNTKSFKISELVRRIRETRSDRTNLWIDLTGSAISALAIKCGGARKVAARITRGGRSLVNHWLPHTLHENEYANVERVAATLGCSADHTVFDRLRGEPLPGFENAVVLCLTTVCRWRNWPLENFRAIVDRFPEVPFVATGFTSEVPVEDRAALEGILRRSNVVSRMDNMSILDLIRLIAHARAVVTNDTSAAHIANAFRKPGAVLFGPASPDKLAPPYGLKSFVDRTCPFHPCVQWTCHNQANWCMRKISARSVAEHLESVLTMTASQAATASVA
jgi:ADP-heptose:LPS heptosyltransferase